MVGGWLSVGRNVINNLLLPKAPGTNEKRSTALWSWMTWNSQPVFLYFLWGLVKLLSLNCCFPRTWQTCVPCFPVKPCSDAPTDTPLSHTNVHKHTQLLEKADCVYSLSPKDPNLYNCSMNSTSITFTLQPRQRLRNNSSFMPIWRTGGRLDRKRQFKKDDVI